MREVKITTSSPLDFEAGMLVKVDRTGPLRRVQKSASGETFLYQAFPGINRHERRASQSRIRRGRY